MSSYLLRPVLPDDVPHVIALIAEIFREYDCVLDAEHEDTHLLAPGDYFRARGGDFWVVPGTGASQSAGTIAGSACGPEAGHVAAAAGRRGAADEPNAAAAARGDAPTDLSTAARVLATVAWLPHGDTAELKCLYVQRAQRGRGWGLRLMEHYFAVARAHGCTRLRLWSDTRFIAAHGLYRRLGFVEFGERDLNDSNHSREFGFERDLPLAPAHPTEPRP